MHHPNLTPTRSASSGRDSGTLRSLKQAERYLVGEAESPASGGQDWAALTGPDKTDPAQQRDRRKQDTYDIKIEGDGISILYCRAATTHPRIVRLHAAARSPANRLQSLPIGLFA